MLAYLVRQAQKVAQAFGKKLPNMHGVSTTLWWLESSVLQVSMEVKNSLPSALEL